MLKIMLSEDNLGSIRHSLRSLLPDVPAAKLAEALAAGLGFRNNAALLASLRTAKVGLSTDQEAFLNRLASLGCPAAPDEVSMALLGALKQYGDMASLHGDSPKKVTVLHTGPWEYSRRGSCLYPDFDPAWTMQRALIALIDMISKHKCDEYKDFSLYIPENPDNNSALSLCSAVVTDGPRIRQVRIPQLMDGRRFSPAKVSEMMRVAFCLSGGNLEDYNSSAVFRKVMNSIIVDGQRVALPKGMEGLTMVFRTSPKMFIMTGQAF